MDNKEKLKIDAAEGVTQELEVSGIQEIIIRKGEAGKVYDPEPVKINGTITAPRSFYDPRKKADLSQRVEGQPFTPYFHPHHTHVVVDRENGQIQLINQENSRFASIITGTLSGSKDYKDLGINSLTPRSPGDLGKLLKRYRHLFPNQEDGMKLIGELLNFSATINTNVEKKEDQRANKKSLLAQSVETNIPLSFYLNVPVFKGSDPVKLKIEINLDSRGSGMVDCYLESPEALDLINTQRDEIIDTQLSAFIEDGISVIEI